jgi:hypothetical protein
MGFGAAYIYSNPQLQTRLGIKSFIDILRWKHEKSSGDDAAPPYGGVPAPARSPTSPAIPRLRVPQNFFAAVPGYGGAAPDASEPAHTDAREVALRQAFNSQGYESVHFKIDRETIVLWGTVPTEADRIMVQTQVFLVAHIFSLEDHIQVRDTFAEP